MRISPIKLMHGLRYAAPILLLALASCGGGGGGTTNPVVKPSAPTGVTAAAGCVAININWAAVTGATGYNVYGVSGVTATKLTTTPVTATSYTDTGLNANTTYNYQVTAFNSAGESPKSNTATAMTSTCTNVGGTLQGTALNLSTAVSTLAGTAGKLGSANGTGASAQFSSPASVTTDGANLYVADKGNNVIRKIVISTGAVTTLAGGAGVGNGTAANDDGTGTAAKFNGPQGITTDGTNLYVADTQSGSIRRITPTGVVTTISVGGTFNLPAAITYDGTNLYVADTNNNAIKLVSTTGVVDGAFTSSVNAPQGITYTGTNLYVTGSGNIYKISTGTGTAASILLSGLSTPQGITTDGTNLYIANNGSHTILKTPITNPSLSIVAGTSGTAGSTDGTGNAALFRNPGGITTDGTNLYITDTGNFTIRKIQ